MENLILSFNVVAPLCLVMALLFLMIMFASPTTVSSFQMAIQMDGDSDLASQIVVFTSALSIVTVFGWIFILKELALI